MTSPTLAFLRGLAGWKVKYLANMGAKAHYAEAEFAGNEYPKGTLAAQLQHALFGGAGQQPEHGPLAAAISPPVASFDGAIIPTIKVLLQPATANIPATVRESGSMAVPLRQVAISFNGTDVTPSFDGGSATGTGSGSIDGGSASAVGASGTMDGGSA